MRKNVIVNVGSYKSGISLSITIKYETNILPNYIENKFQLIINDNYLYMDSIIRLYHMVDFNFYIPFTDEKER